MQWDWVNIVLASAALLGFVVWVIQVYYTLYSEKSVPGVDSANSDEEVTLTDDLHRRLAVIRSSAQILAENREPDEVKRELCRFIIKESDYLTSHLRSSTFQNQLSDKYVS